MGRGAFTLIEMMFVTLVMAVLAAVTAPLLSRSYRYWEGEMAVDRFVQLADYARERAVRGGDALRLSLDSGRGNFVLGASPKEGGFAPLSSRWGRRVRLPEGVSMSSDGNEIVFYPNGTATPARVSFSFSTGEKRRFDIDPLLGAAVEAAG